MIMWDFLFVYLLHDLWSQRNNRRMEAVKHFQLDILISVCVFGYIRIYQGLGGVSSVTRSSLLEIILNLHPRVIFKCNKCTLSMIITVGLTVSNSIIFVWSAGKIWWRWGSSHRWEVHRWCLWKNLQWHIYKRPLLSPPWSIFIFV